MTTKSYFIDPITPSYFPYGQVVLDEESYLTFDKKMSLQLTDLVEHWKHLASPNALSLNREGRR